MAHFRVGQFFENLVSFRFDLGAVVVTRLIIWRFVVADFLRLDSCFKWPALSSLFLFWLFLFCLPVFSAPEQFPFSFFACLFFLALGRVNALANFVHLLRATRLHCLFQLHCFVCVMKDEALVSVSNTPASSVVLHLAQYFWHNARQLRHGLSSSAWISKPTAFVVHSHWQWHCSHVCANRSYGTVMRLLLCLFRLLGIRYSSSAYGRCLWANQVR